MLRSKTFQYKDSAVRSLEVLTTSNKDYWKPILEAGMNVQGTGGTLVC